MEQRLQSRKGYANDAIWRANGVDDGKVVLTKLTLWMPVMTPSITAEERLLSFMDTGGKSLLSWLTVTTDAKEDNVADTFTWHLASKQGVSAPCHIFITLQDRNRLGRQQSSHMIFDRLGVKEVSLEHLDLMGQSVIDIHFSARIFPVGANYRVVAVILSDKSMLLEGVGGPMRIVDAPVEKM